MATSVVMPALEMAQEAGKLVKWYTTEGHAVSKGDLLMSIETDKAVVDVEAEASGVLGGIRARDGDVVRVGQVIAWILAPGEPIPPEQDAPASGRAPNRARSVFIASWILTPTLLTEIPVTSEISR